MLRDVTIVIEDDNIPARKVTKIVRLKDGFAVVVPYHSADRGWLAKMPIDYSKTRWVTCISDATQYTLGARAKLSFHLSGFVHFSGKGVRSGYDPRTGEVKGLGLKFNGPVQIVTGGPAFAIFLWGLEDFRDSGKKRSGVEVFRRQDFYLRGPANVWDGFLVEGFLMPWKKYGSGVRQSCGRLVWVGTLPYISLIVFRHELRIIDLPNLGHFLGIMVSRAPFYGGQRGGKSGFCLSGPSCCGPNEIEPKTIMAWYPYPDEFPPDEVTSLDHPG